MNIYETKILESLNLILENKNFLNEISLINESFGKNVKPVFDTLLIPAKSNSKIYSPVDGVIDNARNPNCITIEIDGNQGYLQYCNITTPSPNLRNGSTVTYGTLLGKTKDDVEVVFFDKNRSRKKLSLNKSFQPRPEKENDTKLKQTKEPRYYDPAMALLPSLVFDLFKDKKDPKTGNVEKRWGYATDKNQVDPWIVNTVSKPFKKVGEKIKSLRKESKDIDRDIQKIKRLIK